MADSGFLLVFQCKECNTILGDSSKSIGDITLLRLTSMSSNVKSQVQDILCPGCEKVVGIAKKDLTFQLKSEHIRSTPVGNSGNKNIQAALEEQAARIIELGVQAVADRLDIITLKYAVEYIHPEFSVENFRSEFSSK